MICLQHDGGSDHRKEINNNNNNRNTKIDVFNYHVFCIKNTLMVLYLFPSPLM